MYSFGRRHPYNPFWGGFVIESPRTGTFKRFSETKVLVLSVSVTEEQHAELKEMLDVEAEEEVQLQLYWLMSGMLPCCLEAGGLLLLLRVCRRASHKKSG